MCYQVPSELKTCLIRPYPRRNCKLPTAIQCNNKYNAIVAPLRLNARLRLYLHLILQPAHLTLLSYHISNSFINFIYIYHTLDNNITYYIIISEKIASHRFFFRSLRSRRTVCVEGWLSHAITRTKYLLSTYRRYFCNKQ